MHDGRADRYEWIDLAKASSILLVVLHHEVIHYAAAGGFGSSAAVGAWNAINAIFVPVRMPLFFLASGLLASSSLRRSRPEAFRKRIYQHVYLYAIWAAIFAALIPGWPNLHGVDVPLADLATSVVVGTTPVWYLWALPLAFLAGWLTRGLPAWLPISFAAVLAVLPVEHHYSGNLLRCLVYFLVGLRLPGLAALVASRADGRLFAACLVAFAGLSALDPQAKAWARPLLEIAGVAAAVLGCVLACRASSGAVALGGWLARRTLPIYLLHFPLVTALAALVPLALPTHGAAVWAIAFPPIATALVVAGSLALHAVLVAGRAGWLFGMPAWAAKSARETRREGASRPDGAGETSVGPAAGAPA